MRSHEICLKSPTRQISKGWSPGTVSTDPRILPVSDVFFSSVQSQHARDPIVIAMRLNLPLHLNFPYMFPLISLNR